MKEVIFLRGRGGGEEQMIRDPCSRQMSGKAKRQMRLHASMVLCKHQEGGEGRRPLRPSTGPEGDGLGKGRGRVGVRKSAKASQWRRGCKKTVMSTEGTGSDLGLAVATIECINGCQICLWWVVALPASLHGPALLFTAAQPHRLLVLRKYARAPRVKGKLPTPDHQNRKHVFRSEEI